jgi:hypothetical protein
MLNVTALKTPFTRTHLGIRLHYLSIKKDVMKVIEKLTANNPNKPIRITGHSLGDALAREFYKHLKRKKYNVVDGQGFGGYGAYAFIPALAFPKGFTRWVNENDKVPNIHMLKALGFMHPIRSDEHYLTTDGGLMINPNKLKRLKDKIKDYRESRRDGNFEWVADHDLYKEYHLKIKKLVA